MSAIKLAAVDYLLKPIDKALLEHAVAKAMDRARAAMPRDEGKLVFKTASGVLRLAPGEIACAKADGNYARVAQTIHVEEAIDRYDGPVLIVQGDQDDPGLMQSAVDAANRYQHCDLVMIQGDTHCYDYHLEEMTDAVRKWMLERN